MLFFMCYKKNSSGGASTSLVVNHAFITEHQLCPELTAVSAIDQIPNCGKTQRDSGQEVLGRCTELLENEV